MTSPATDLLQILRDLSAFTEATRREAHHAALDNAAEASRAERVAASLRSRLEASLHALAARTSETEAPAGSPSPARHTLEDGSLCACEACLPQGSFLHPENMRMIVCAKCGNKRCPHATDHRNACTNSNEPGQKGSSYEHFGLAKTNVSAAAPETINPAETCQLVGVKRDGTEVVLGTIPLPPTLKAKEIIGSYFGRDFDDEDSPAAMALSVCTELVDWMAGQPAAAPEFEEIGTLQEGGSLHGKRYRSLWSDLPAGTKVYARKVQRKGEQHVG